ncbi:hypothetical protein COOONC_18551 [Cooperia oncophora]
MSLGQAEKACNEKGATLFCASDFHRGEFNEVMKETPPYFWSWIGLGQCATDSFPRWQVAGPDGSSHMSVCIANDDFGKPSFVGYEGLDPLQLKWLILPFSSVPNGWSSIANCVGFYNMNSYSSSYLYFYPCSSLFHSVCERNLTLTNLL